MGPIKNLSKIFIPENARLSNISVATKPGSTANVDTFVSFNLYLIIIIIIKMIMMMVVITVIIMMFMMIITIVMMKTIQTIVTVKILRPTFNLGSI